MKILGIDASLTHTGLALIEEGKEPITSCIVPKTRGVERLADIRGKLREVCIQHKPDLAVMEGYAYSPFGGQTFSLGELGGVIKLLLYKLGVDYLIVAPTTLKKFATGSGKAQKSEIMLKVYKRWNIEFDNEHICDSYVLARLGEAILKGSEYIKTLPDYQQECIQVVLKGENNEVKNLILKKVAKGTS